MSGTAESTFDELQAALKTSGPEGALAAVADHLLAEKRFHELFDVRLMQARLRYGLPVILTTTLDELEEPLRSKMEEAYLAACREVGGLFILDSQVREAWMYLRPVGDKAAMAEALAKLPAEDHYEEIIEIALHEGVAPKLGFQTVLAHYGICNAISLFDGEMQNRPRSQRQEVAALLVQQLHQDLTANLVSDITRQQGSPPTEKTIRDLVAERDWLFANDNYHIDTSHLSSIVRFAAILEDAESLRLALDLTEYGRRLSSQYQFRGEEPFTDLYPSSALLFQAGLGENVDEAIRYFREQAASRPASEAGPMPAEVLVRLLAAAGRYDEALEAYGELLPQGTRTWGFAPTLLELARQSGHYDQLTRLCRDRGDMIGFTAGLVEGHLKQT